MTTTAAVHSDSSVGEPGGGGPVVLVAECTTVGGHLMVAVPVDAAQGPRLQTAVTTLLEGEGLWCGPAAASRRCRAGLLELVVAGGVSAEVIDAAGYDDPAHARAACLAGVAEIADDLGANRVLLVRDDVCAATDEAGSAALFHRVGASPELLCSHADVEGEPLTVLAEVIVWCWMQGGELRRAVAAALAGVRVA